MVMYVRLDCPALAGSCNNSNVLDFVIKKKKKKKKKKGENESRRWELVCHKFNAHFPHYYDAPCHE